ncbi:MAG: type IV pilus twitching motility protein PilT [Oligoflexales bacterium]
MSEDQNNLPYTLSQLLKALVDQGGSDLHLAVGSSPRMRVNGVVLALDLDVLTPQDTHLLCTSVLTEEKRNVLERNKEIDLSFQVGGVGRFRANVFFQKGSLSGVFRWIPLNIPTLNSLKLPRVIQNLTKEKQGLILVTGPTGSGKSTTLAALVDDINSHQQKHIVTLEDPIEFLHVHKKSLVNQREIGRDSESFSRALKSALRQDPDVVLVGELRDQDSVSMAMTMAETGHLVLATLHTNSAIATLSRIIDVFPSHQQSQIQTQLSFSLTAVLAQTLLPSIRGGRVMAMEALIPNSAVRNLIREGKMHQVYSQMQVGQEKTQMFTLNQSLMNLVRTQQISIDVALNASYNSIEFQEMLSKNKIGRS